MDKFNIELVWNREFHWSHYDSSTDLNTAIKMGNGILESGDGARVKKYRILNNEGEVVYPNGATESDYYPKLYTCSFCDKQALGKPYSYLIKPNKFSNHDVALRPIGWDWDIVPLKFTDSWSCGCHKFNRNSI